jgi:hypothetical protein
MPWRFIPRLAVKPCAFGALCRSLPDIYTRFDKVKARFFIVFSAIFALVLCAPALGAEGTSRAAAHLRAVSCCTPLTANFDRQLEAANADHSFHQLASPLKHRSPTHNSQRKRGKKISIQGSQPLQSRCFSPARYLLSFTSVARQHAGGPNPSRGPPSFISL